MQRNPLQRAIRLGGILLGLACVTPAAASSGTWPQIGYDSGHTAYNPTESIINSHNVATLTRTATLATPGQVADPVMIADGVAYVNSIGADALYAFNVASGQQLWTFPGINQTGIRGIAVAGAGCSLRAQSTASISAFAP